MIPPPPPVEIGSGWYLRGDIGFTAQRVDHLYNLLYDTTAVVNTYEQEFGKAASIGAGFGYRWNDFFRTDITAEYRTKSAFHGYETYDTEGDDTIDGDDRYNANKTEVTILANAYVDLGTYQSITPFVGAGIGASYNTINGFTDENEMNSGYATGGDHSQWGFAWALYAGLGWAISPQWTLEVAYRYLNLGNAASGDLVPSSGPNDYNNPMEFHDLTSHDIKVGLRYAIW
jgi:opacity protein-like surface antigen